MRTRQSLRSTSFFYTGWWMAFVVFVIVFCVLATMANPQRDDFLFALGVTNPGYWKLQKEMYLHWQGRYVSNLIGPAYAVFAIRQELYWLHPILLLAGSFAALCSFVKEVARWLCLQVSRREILFSGSLLLMTIQFCMPSVSEGYFWLSAAFTYQTGFIFMLLLAAQLLRMHRLSGSGVPSLLVAVLLSLLVAGSNEIAAMVMLTSTALWWFWRGRFGMSGKARCWLFFCVLGSAASLLCPGAWNRAAVMGDYNLFSPLVALIYWPFYSLVKMAAQPLFWGMLAFFYYAGKKQGLPVNSKWLRHRKYLAVLLLPWLVLAPVLFTSRGSLPLRALNTITDVWLLLFAAMSFLQGVRRNEAGDTKFAGRWKAALVLVLATAIVYNGYLTNMLQGYFFNRLVKRNISWIKAGAPGKEATLHQPYHQAVKPFYKASAIPKKEIVWEYVKELPVLIGNYEDFENFNEKSGINLYYRSVFR